MNFNSKVLMITKFAYVYSKDKNLFVLRVFELQFHWANKTFLTVTARAQTVNVFPIFYGYVLQSFRERQK